jgi:hypothetical protein
MQHYLLHRHSITKVFLLSPTVRVTLLSLQGFQVLQQGYIKYLAFCLKVNFRFYYDSVKKKNKEDCIMIMPKNNDMLMMCN